EGHDGYDRGRTSEVRAVVPAVSGHEGQAGASVWLRVHVPGRSQEARWFDAHHEANKDSERGNRGNAQPTGRAVQGGGPTMSSARCSGKRREEQAEGADDRE
ncbi:MAG: hypothetical protein ACK55Z_11425, partial [bacterium]